MNINEIVKKYSIPLDDSDKVIINKRVREKGIEGYLNQQLVYLDCSRIIKGLRMMQTIGYPYQREITSYLYALGTVAGNDFDFDKEWSNKLIERHNANIEYEKENPPIWYRKSKKVSKRKSKNEEGDMFSKETKKTKISKAEAKLKAKLLGASLGFGSFKLKK